MNYVVYKANAVGVMAVYLQDDVDADDGEDDDEGPGGEEDEEYMNRLRKAALRMLKGETGEQRGMNQLLGGMGTLRLVWGAAAGGSSVAWGFDTSYCLVVVHGSYRHCAACP